MRDEDGLRRNEEIARGCVDEGQGDGTRMGLGGTRRWDEGELRRDEQIGQSGLRRNEEMRRRWVEERQGDRMRVG